MPKFARRNSGRLRTLSMRAASESGVCAPANPLQNTSSRAARSEHTNKRDVEFLSKGGSSKAGKDHNRVQWSQNAKCGEACSVRKAPLGWVILLDYGLYQRNPLRCSSAISRATESV